MQVLERVFDLINTSQVNPMFGTAISRFTNA